MKKLIALIAVAASLVTASLAGVYTPLQSDTNSYPVVTTNTYALYGDTLVNTNGTALSDNFINASQTSTLYLSAGGLFANTTNAAQSHTVRLSGSVDGKAYTNNAAAIVITVPALVTNYYYGFLTVSSPFPFYSVRTVENTNNFSIFVTNAVYGTFTNAIPGPISVKGFSKPGI